MKVVLLLLLCAIVARASYCPSYLPPRHDSACGFTRENAYHCIMSYIDTNHNDQVTQQEVDAAIQAYAPWYVRALSWFTGTSDVFAGCDYNSDGVLTPRDWTMSTETCLPTQEALCQFHWFCECAKNTPTK